MTTTNHDYEFGGPLGAIGITLGCPIIAYLQYFVCGENGCPSDSFLSAPIETLKSQWPGWGVLYSHSVFMKYCQYFFALVLLHYILPGKHTHGVLLRDGTRKKYKMAALPTFITVVGGCAVMTYKNGLEWWLWSWIWDNYIQLLTASLAFATLQAFYVYTASFFTGELLAEGGATGNPIYDWFIGRPLNPRIGDFDLKVFSELTPGMTLWSLLNFTFLAQQYRTYGRITDSMILTNVFQSWYVLDSYINEVSVLTTMDITADGFGYMLSFGDLTWVPFVYSLQSRYLATHPVDLGAGGVAGVLAVQALGYWIFRGSNGQKNKFRTNPQDPSVKHIEYIETKAGSRLMVSGWWGVARHINYLGDWIMAWAWCLPTGFGTPITYFYVVYFAILLIHRDRRDEAKCVAKYGADWERYRKRVPYRFLPGIY